jgi:hypothetical protein
MSRFEEMVLTELGVKFYGLGRIYPDTPKSPDIDTVGIFFEDDLQRLYVARDPRARLELERYIKECLNLKLSEVEIVDLNGTSEDGSDNL